MDENISGLRHTYSVERIDSLFKDNIIGKDVRDSYLKSLERLNLRRTRVREMIINRSYPFRVTKEELIFDITEGLIDEDQYRTFSWFLEQDLSDAESDIVSVKLKLSVWGLRLPGRYDTFEHILDIDDKELRQRAYCIHGTLFEGCGNYKAPEMAQVSNVPDNTVNIFGKLISHLIANGTLEKDYSTSPFNCGFFDLYVRTADSKIHTKGTTEFPEFIKFIMFVMGAELNYY